MTRHGWLKTLAGQPQGFERVYRRTPEPSTEERDWDCLAFDAMSLSDDEERGLELR